MREPFDRSAYYHVYNRGVDKRNIFEDPEDIRRFYNSLYLLNDDLYRHPGTALGKEALISAAGMLAFDRKTHVSVAAFCLMRNHFHLLLKESMPGGISKFLHKLEMSYSKGFNEKYERTGALFEGAFKARPVDREEHLQLLPRYIHLNALDGTPYHWRDGQAPDWDAAEGILEAHHWSSHSVYAHGEQDLPVVDTDIVRRWFPTTKEYDAYLRIPTVYGSEDPTFAINPG